METITITNDEFTERFKPQKNHLDDNASWDGCMYETYGPELEYVAELNREQPKRVWTVMSDDDGDLCVGDGMHFVNRMGFLITEVECPPETFVSVTDGD